MVSNLLPNAATYYSSIINTNDNPILTLQARLSEYTGDITIEGTVNQQATDWYPITTDEYSNNTDTHGWTIRGYHPFVRMVFISNAGEVTNILAR